MDETRTRIFRVIGEYHMIEPGMRVIAGVSGGADSVCLLDVLARYRREVSFELLVVHVEHGLRGQESLADAAFVETLCESMRIPCRVEHADVHGRMRQEGLSCEEAGRAERYRIFDGVSREWGAQRIAVAHNQNDQAETVLWNLARGSGLNGLGGIRPVQGKIIRPLLFTEREEIERYLRREGLSWRTDATNLETAFTRNRIRLSILPRMEQELNAQASRHIAQASVRLREVQEYIDRMTDRAAARCIFIREDDGAYPIIRKNGLRPDIGKSREKSEAEVSVCIRLEPFQREDSLIRRELIKRALQICARAEASRTWDPDIQGPPEKSGMKDVGAVHIEMLERLADMDCGKSCDLPNGICAVREDGILRFGRKESSPAVQNGLKEQLSPENACSYTELPVPGQVICGGVRVTAELMANTPELKKYFLEEKKYTKWISYDTITSNLQLRTRRTGDYLAVNAQGGTKKLKDYFIDRKVPREMRDRILLLADGPHILWVIGYRLSEAARVTEDTRRVLKVVCEADTGETACDSSGV